MRAIWVVAMLVVAGSGCSEKSASNREKPVSDGPALRILAGECKMDRAVIGLDKVSAICHVENPDTKPHMVHVVGSFVTDNFASRTGSKDVAISPGAVGDAQVDFENVNLGKSAHPRCECNVTSPEGYPIK